MIQIIKGEAPAILLTHGVAGHAEIADAIANGKKPVFRRAIYAHRAVKAALRSAQHNKCAFCEASYEHVDFGDVEHYRPKNGFVQTAGDRLEKPGYYWFTYEWDNLLLSCKRCNQHFKRNLFPLSDPTQRCRLPTDLTSRETPLLIHPATEDPEDIITFVGEMAKPKRSMALKGKTTIGCLGLNRDPLRKDRLKSLAILKFYHNTLSLLRRDNVPDDNPHSAEAIQFLGDAVLPNSEYSSMAKAFLSSQKHTFS